MPSDRREGKYCNDGSILRTGALEDVCASQEILSLDRLCCFVADSRLYLVVASRSLQANSPGLIMSVEVLVPWFVGRGRYV